MKTGKFISNNKEKRIGYSAEVYKPYKQSLTYSLTLLVL